MSKVLAYHRAAMSEKPDEIDVVKAATDAATALVKQSYDDLAHPAASEVGKALKALGSIVRFAFRPIETIAMAGNLLWDRLDDNLKKRFEKEPPENIVEPPPHVAGPLLLSYPFVEQQDELRRLFVELLAKSMLVDSRQLVHPAYVEILKQLSPDEARL